MSVIKGNHAGSAGSDFYSYKINQSLRFNDGDSPLLYRTPGSAGNRRTWTYSFWVKRSVLGSYMGLLAVGTGDGSEDVLKFEPNNTFNFRYDSGSDLTTNMLFRDVSAWYHIVVVADTTQSQSSSTASDSRLRLYVNGSQITSLSSSNMPSQNFEFRINTAAQHYIGEFPRVNGHLDGYLAEVNFIDGTAYDASNFGETKDGVWVPKDASGLTFGTNGYYLPFDDSSAIGDDESANTNDFTVSGLAATDVVTDSPTNNFCTLNSTAGNGDSISEGNLKGEGDSGSAKFQGWTGTLAMSSGKWYWEVNAVDVNNIMQIGVHPTGTGFTTDTNLSYQTDSMIYNSGGTKGIGTGGTGPSAGTKTNTSYGASYTDGDIIGVALDLDSGTTTLTFYKNNSTQGAAFSNLASDEYTALYTGIDNSLGIFNFGQDGTFAGTKTAQGNADGNGVGDFYYAPPSGFLALCTANLPDPTIGPTASTLATDNFNTVLYTGNLSTQSITGVGFQPDWVWLKSRDSTYDHTVYDVIRGATYKLAPNDTYQESADADTLTSFDSDGFSVGDDVKVNDDDEPMASWNWKAGGSASSNSDGSITSSVSANTAAGFSVGTYTHNGSGGQTIGHGLSSAPEMVIIKQRSGGNDWVVFENSRPDTEKYLRLNATGDYYDYGATLCATPGATTFELTYAPSGYTSDTSGNYVFYCFHSVEGYSKVGKYTGNNSTDGTFVFTGFRPAWIFIKCTTAVESWYIFDTARDPSNLTTQYLNPNLANPESNATNEDRSIDILSNGFKCRGSNSSINNGTYIYLAFAEVPFKFANAR